MLMTAVPTTKVLEFRHLLEKQESKQKCGINGHKKFVVAVGVRAWFDKVVWTEKSVLCLGNFVQETEFCWVLKKSKRKKIKHNFNQTLSSDQKNRLWATLPSLLSRLLCFWEMPTSSRTGFCVLGTCVWAGHEKALEGDGANDDENKKADSHLVGFFVVRSLRSQEDLRQVTPRLCGRHWRRSMPNWQFECCKDECWAVWSEGAWLSLCGEFSGSCAPTCIENGRRLGRNLLTRWFLGQSSGIYLTRLILSKPSSTRTIWMLLLLVRWSFNTMMRSDARGILRSIRLLMRPWEHGRFRCELRDGHRPRSGLGVVQGKRGRWKSRGDASTVMSLDTSRKTVLGNKLLKRNREWGSRRMLIACKGGLRIGASQLAMRVEGGRDVTGWHRSHKSYDGNKNIFEGKLVETPGRFVSVADGRKLPVRGRGLVPLLVQLANVSQDVQDTGSIRSQLEQADLFNKASQEGFWVSSPMYWQWSATLEVKGHWCSRHRIGGIAPHCDGRTRRSCKCSQRHLWHARLCHLSEHLSNLGDDPVGVEKMSDPMLYEACQKGKRRGKHSRECHWQRQSVLAILFTLTLLGLFQPRYLGLCLCCCFRWWLFEVSRSMSTSRQDGVWSVVLFWKVFDSSQSSWLWDSTYPLGLQRRVCQQYVDEWFTQRSILHTTTAPYSPAGNGIAERSWRTLFNMVRSMLFAKLDEKFWAWAIQAACRTLNRTVSWKCSRKTPHEILQGRATTEAAQGICLPGTCSCGYTRGSLKREVREVSLLGMIGWQGVIKFWLKTKCELSHNVTKEGFTTVARREAAVSHVVPDFAVVGLLSMSAGSEERRFDIICVQWCQELCKPPKQQSLDVSENASAENSENDDQEE